MRTKWTLLLTAVVVFAPIVRAAAVTVRLRRMGAVTSGELKIADVASVYGSDEALARRVASAPLGPLGERRRRTVKIMEVKLALLKSGFNLAEIVVKGASSCLVKLHDEGKLKSSAADWRTHITKAARELIAERAGVEPGEVEVDGLSLPAEIEDLYRNGHHFKFIKSKSTPGPGRIQLELMALKNATFTKRLAVTLAYSLNVGCAVATRVLKKGDVIGRSDVALKSLSLPDPKKGYYKSLEEIIGMEVSSTLVRGEVIKPSALKVRMLVRRGDIVRVVFRRSRVVVETSARAAGSATKGEMVSLEDLANRRKKYAGVVVGPRLVEVK